MPIKEKIMWGTNIAANHVNNTTEPNRIPMYLKGAEAILEDAIAKFFRLALHFGLMQKLAFELIWLAKIYRQYLGL